MLFGPGLLQNPAFTSSTWIWSDMQGTGIANPKQSHPLLGNGQAYVLFIDQEHKDSNVPKRIVPELDKTVLVI
jgi:hypothetical protein